MKTSLSVIIFMCFIFANISAVQLQQVITDPKNGLTVNTIIDKNYQVPDIPELRLDGLWQTSDPAAICGDVLVSETTQNTFARWQTNTERVSLFEYNGNTAWEHVVGNLDFDYPIDMLESGDVLAVGDGNILKILSPDSSTPTWSYTHPYPIRGIRLSAMADVVFISYYNEVENSSGVQCYTIGDDTPLWDFTFPGAAGTLTLSNDASILIYTQYGGENSYMWVMDTETGETIFQTEEHNQNPPAISADGSIIVNGDYSGYLWVYEYDEALQTYAELWHYHINGGGTSDWIGGMAISADGSTIAAGTLTFLTGGYNGQIYLFNIYSPTPVWVYENAGDYVIDVDLSADGSVLAAAGYGPYGATGDEFFLFRRQSNIPVYTIDAPGSMFAVDLSADGTFCTVGGKAVHAREMGSGGNIYSIDCDLGGGNITGNVNLDGAEDNSNVFVEVTGLIDYYGITDTEGNYIINNIPEGLYTIEYSKTGYETYSDFNGIVIEGETTEMDDVTLTPYGDPPLNLTASQGADITVMLNWDLPASGEAPGYYIYRKLNLADPYPVEPYDIIFAENSYIDDSALPEMEYYYVVTAMTAEGYQSPYSNQATGWISTGFISEELNVTVGTTPVIDGIISDQEWEDAFCFNASDFWGSYDSTPQPIGSVTGYLKMNADQTEFYGAFINLNDPILEDHDEVALYIDDNGDGAYPPVGENTEGNFWAVYYAAGNELRFRPIYNTGVVGDVVYLPDPQVAASDESGSVIFEFMIPMSDNPSHFTPGPENFSKIGIFVLDDNTPDPHDFDAWWPHDNIDIFDPAGYGIMNYAIEYPDPLPPENLTIENMPGNIFHLTWDMPDILNFDHFNIYYALQDEQFELIDTSISTSYDYEYEFLPQTSYSFYLTTVNQAGMESDASEIAEYVTTDNDPSDIPLVTALLPNYPNPFNPLTTINFSIAENNSRTIINIYNIKGQKIKSLLDEEMPAGNHQVIWNGTNSLEELAASGLYFYSLQNDKYSAIRKMILLK
ncbi:MAG: T9SS type A sorting domain-containing protein [Candidatus Stygibacter frigidus]|nr:T9SS type A sorting domain-containing protein [Candidatus Stygibacter frigidus]